MKKSLQTYLCMVMASFLPSLMHANTYTFTSAGATGREGPTQTQVDDNYTGSSLEDAVTVDDNNTQGIQEWTVPADGSYSIEVFGAQGGNNNWATGGKGARMKGTFSQDSGSVLKIVVGAKGSSSSTFRAGGGGGTFVWLNGASQPLIVAGGGGGGGTGTNSNGIENGQTGTDGEAGFKEPDAWSAGVGGAGGTNGSGGQAGVGGNSLGHSGGGAGWLSSGSGTYPGLSKFEFTGGDGNTNGGFGGGGGVDNSGAGGGGGYSGGGGSGWGTGSPNANAPAGGGGSYNSGTDQNNTAGANEGHGKVIITFLGYGSEAPEITQGAGPLNKTMDEDTNATWLSSELNATDSDTNAPSLAWSLLIAPSHGTATVNGNGTSPSTLFYQPNADYHGSDSFSVQVSDGENNDSITIDLTISPIDDATSITGDANATISEDTSATGDLNATDADGLTDGSYFSVSTPPANGSAAIDPVDGNWTYIPNPNFFGSDSFAVSVTDDLNTTTTSTINQSVSPVGDATFVSGDTNSSIAEDTYASGDLNATDADGLTDGSYFSIFTTPASGSAVIDPVDGNWTYYPNPNFFGSDSFVISVTDDLNTSTTSTINLSVSPVGDATIVSGDTNSSIAEDTYASGDLNATDADGLTDGSYFSILTTPASGSAVIDPVDGNWTYSPNPNFFGSDSFVISVTDDLNTSTTSTINLSVSPVGDATIVSGDTTSSIAEDAYASGDLNATDADGLSDGSYFSISTVPANGSASIDPVNGNWTYSPNPNFFGSDSFVVSVTDDLNTSFFTTINLSVSEVAEPDSDYTSPDDSTSSPDDQFASPDGSTSSPDSAYQSPTESYSSPDSNYSTPDDSVSSPEDAYSTPDDSVTSPDEVYSTPSGDIASTDSGYQSPSESYSSPDSNYSTPDDSTSSPEDAYSTPDDSVTSPDEVYTSPSGDTASPGSGYQSPTESYSSPDSNYSTPDDSTSSPDGSYATPDDSVSSPDDQYASPEYHLPIVETGQPSVDATGSLILSGSVHSDGGSVLLEVGFMLSPTLDFNQSERFVTELDSGSGEFILQTSNDSAQFIRAFASNMAGESLGQVVALESPSYESSAWADAQSLPGGWLQSDWLGTFQPYANGWIFHARLGWLYAPASTGEGVWLWSSTEGWLWTQNGIAPHFFDHDRSDWLYLLPAGEHGKTFYDYTIEDVR